MRAQQDEQIVDGFSSDEEFKEEEIMVHEKRSSEAHIVMREEVKYKIPPAP